MRQGAGRMNRVRRGLARRTHTRVMLCDPSCLTQRHYRFLTAQAPACATKKETVSCERLLLHVDGSVCDQPNVILNGVFICGKRHVNSPTGFRQTRPMIVVLGIEFDHPIHRAISGSRNERGNRGADHHSGTSW